MKRNMRSGGRPGGRPLRSALNGLARIANYLPQPECHIGA
jgi:hypothetical protein